MFRNKKIIVLLIIMLGSFLRFWQLGIIPVGVTNDELGYIYNAYSIAKTGRNVFGEFLPFLTWLHSGGFPFLPVPIYFSVPFFWFLDISATAGRLPSAILGTIDIVLLFFLVKQIFKNNNLAILSAFFLAISPWHIHFSRSSYDPNFALFFYLLAIVVFIYEIRRERIPIFSLISFLLAVFSYRGMNPVFFPLMILLVWYGIKVLKITKKQLTVFFAGIGFIVSILIFVIVINGGKYTSEALIFNDPKMQQYIDAQIREAQGPLFIRRLFLNKLTYNINKLRENYVKAYSPEFLFLYTEPNQIYSIWSRGRIYFLDLIFIILGIAFLFKLNKKGAFFITALVLIGGLPGMAGGMPYSARDFFLSAIFPVLSSGGVLLVLDILQERKLRYIVAILFFFAYSYLLASYLFDYYGRYALTGAENWAKSLKDISLIINSNKEKNSKIVVGTSSFVDFMQYAFYSKVHPKEVQYAWKTRKNGMNEYFLIENVNFVSGCPEYFEKGAKTGQNLYIAHEGCYKNATPSASVQDYYGNTIWEIYNKK